MHLVRGGVVLNAREFVCQTEGILDFFSQNILLVLIVALSKESIGSDLARLLRLRRFSVALLVIRPLREYLLRVSCEKTQVMVTPHLAI